LNLECYHLHCTADLRFPAPSRWMWWTGNVQHGQHMYIFHLCLESCLHTSCFWRRLVFSPKPLPRLVHILLSSQVLLLVVFVVNSPKRLQGIFNFVCLCLHSQGGSVSVASSCGLNVTASIPGMARFFLFSTQHPDQLWGPHSLLSSGYQGWFPRG
jgi:hypothetical protein